MKEITEACESAETLVVQEVIARVKVVTTKAESLIESLEHLYGLEEDVKKLTLEERIKLADSPELMALSEIIEKLQGLL